MIWPERRRLFTIMSINNRNIGLVARGQHFRCLQSEDLMNDQQLIVRSLLVLIQLDAAALYDRLKYNFREYMQIFTTKRTREHFKDVLRTRF